MLIRAAVAQAQAQDFEILEVMLDAPRDDEILVRIGAVGICHTDLVARALAPAGALPAVFGHEGAGIVEKIGAAVTKVRPGDHVVLSFRSCLGCPQCLAHEPAYCDYHLFLNFAGTRADGSKTLRRCDRPLAGNFFGQSSFATHALSYESNTVKVDPQMPFALLAPLGCGIQTGVGAVLNALRCAPGSSILITGAGSVGLSAVMGAKVAQCATIIVSDPLAPRRALAMELGATHGHDPAGGELTDFVRSIAPAGVGYALDMTGAGPVMDAALRCLRRKGKLGIIGIPAPGTPSPGTAMELLSNGGTITGIVEGDSDPDIFIPRLIALYRAGKLPFDRLITTYDFNEINRAVADQATGLCTKAVLVMPGVPF